jgi:predicted CopG family antitoxin
MSKLIRVSDEVYNRLDSLKRRRDTFEDVIFDMLQELDEDDPE